MTDTKFFYFTMIRSRIHPHGICTESEFWTLQQCSEHHRKIAFTCEVATCTFNFKQTFIESLVYRRCCARIIVPNLSQCLALHSINCIHIQITLIDLYKALHHSQEMCIILSWHVHSTASYHVIKPPQFNQFKFHDLDERKREY